jgi:hypothetical protein
MFMATLLKTKHNFFVNFFLFFPSLLAIEILQFSNLIVSIFGKVSPVKKIICLLMW